MAVNQPINARCQMPPWPVPDALNFPAGAALMASASSFTVLYGESDFPCMPGGSSLFRARRGGVGGLLGGGEIGRPWPMHHRDLDRDDAERVAVGRGGRNRRMADDARAADAVDDAHRLPEILLEQSRDDARGGVGAAARAPRADQLDRTGGIILLRKR